MKRIIYFPLMLGAVLMIAASCNKVDYKKTSSGLLYKIVSNGKDSLVKDGQWLKLHFQQRISRSKGKDSVLQSSYGKMPVYAQVAENPQNNYSPGEIFKMLRKGDSVLTVVITDSLLKKGQLQELLPFMRKGDRITTGFRVVDVFRDEASLNADRQKEEEKDRPRMMKEREEAEASSRKMRKEMQDKQVAEYEKSGEAAKQNATMETYLAGKNIKAEKAGTGVYIVMSQPGTGDLIKTGQYVTVKYEGKSLRTDSTFDAGTFTRAANSAELIAGMDQALLKFRKGGKGTIFIPGYLAYGENPDPRSPFKPNEALRFDMEILDVSDKMPEPQGPPGQ